MKETDWDMPDEDAIIDFDAMTDLELTTAEKEEEKPKLKPQRDEPPKTTQKIHVEPPPRKEEPMMSEKQEKIISNATKSAQKLSKELETLDFQIEKFTKFEKKVSSFKIKNTIAVGAVALFLGGYIGSLAQSELNNYYVNQEVRAKLGAAAAELDLLQKAKAAGVIFAIDGDRIVVWTTAQNKAVSVAQNDQHKIFEIDLKKVKK